MPMQIKPLNTGIEGVLWEDSAQGLEHFKTPDLLPGDVPSLTSMEGVWGAKRLEDALIPMCCPDISQRHILKPYAFSALTARMPEVIRERAATVDSPVAQGTLMRAADVLEEQRANQEIWKAYSNMLLRG